MPPCYKFRILFSFKFLSNIFLKFSNSLSQFYENIFKVSVFQICMFWNSEFQSCFWHFWVILFLKSLKHCLSYWSLSKFWITYVSRFSRWDLTVRLSNVACLKASSKRVRTSSSHLLWGSFLSKVEVTQAAILSKAWEEGTELRPDI